MIDVSDLVGQADHLALQGLRHVRPGVAEDPPADLIAEVQAVAAVFQPVHHPQRLLVVAEPAGQDLV